MKVLFIYDHLTGYHFDLECHSARLVLASFWLTVLLLTAVYTGNLTASLAVSDVQMPFSTLDELAQDDQYILQIMDGTSQLDTFRVTGYNTVVHR